MSELERSFPRRTVLQSAGIGIGASLLSGLATPAQQIEQSSSASASRSRVYPRSDH